MSEEIEEYQEAQEKQEYCEILNNVNSLKMKFVYENFTEVQGFLDYVGCLLLSTSKPPSTQNSRHHVLLHAFSVLVASGAHQLPGSKQPESSYQVHVSFLAARHACNSQL